jgi:hypothetical protein
MSASPSHSHRRAMLLRAAGRWGATARPYSCWRGCWRRRCAATRPLACGAPTARRRWSRCFRPLPRCLQQLHTLDFKRTSVPHTRRCHCLTAATTTRVLVYRAMPLCSLRRRSHTGLGTRASAATAASAPRRSATSMARCWRLWGCCAARTRRRRARRRARGRGTAAPALSI